MGLGFSKGKGEEQRFVTVAAQGIALEDDPSTRACFENCRIFRADCVVPPGAFMETTNAAVAAKLN